MDAHTLSADVTASADTAAEVSSAAPTLAQVEAEHGPDEARFGCRCCGWAYVGGITACPPLLMARAGLPQVASQISYGQGAVDRLADEMTEQISDLAAEIREVRTGQLDVLATLTELRELHYGRTPEPYWSGWRHAARPVLRLAYGLAAGVAVLWALPALPTTLTRVLLLVVAVSGIGPYIAEPARTVWALARSGFRQLADRFLTWRLDRPLVNVDEVDQVDDVNDADGAAAVGGVR